MARVRTLLTVADCMLSMFLLTPLVTAHWRGTWNILDLYLFPANLQLSAWVSAVVGSAGCLVFYLFQDVFKTVFSEPSRVHRLLTFSVYSLVFAMFSIGQFRGVWLLWNYHVGTDARCVLISSLVGFLGASVFRAGRNSCAQPFIGTVDNVNDFFDCATRFQAKVRLFNIHITAI